ncbi:MAG: DUF885 domain-containing protein [Isosphaeraceae bacterium]
MTRRWLRFSFSLFLLLGSGIVQADEPATADRALAKAVEHYWPDLLKRHPVEATLFVGDHRFDDRVNDASPAAHDAWIAHLQSYADELRASLAPTDAAGKPRRSQQDQVNLETLARMYFDRLELARFGDNLIPLTQLWRTPTDIHSDDLHLAFAELGQFHPAATIGDVANFVRRLESFPKMVDGLIATMKLGVARQRVPARVVADRVVIQLESLADPKVESHPLWGFASRLPEDWPDSERNAAKERVRNALAKSVIPAYARLAAYTKNEYRPACREQVGLSATPDGAEHYAFLVRHYTTTDLTPDQVHDLGLQQVARVRTAMEAIRREVGFDGTLTAFLAHVRDDPKLKNTSGPGIVARHREILEEMRRNLPKLFGRLPVSDFEVREFDPVRAKSSPAGEYLPMPADGSRPGIFFVNTLDPPSRPVWTMQALAYHEAVPGHHLQGALAAEAPARPPFRRFFYLPAYDEGWALYSEGLGEELGLYRDPYTRLGRHVYDAQRCVRLVVDTGIHSRGWSRDQAIAYFEANTAIPRNEIANEVDRYIAWPGQALAYKVGELKIRELRGKQQARLGYKFDIRAFHDRLLGYGSVPLAVLEKLMNEP